MIEKHRHTHGLNTVRTGTLGEFLRFSLPLLVLAAVVLSVLGITQRTAFRDRMALLERHRIYDLHNSLQRTLEGCAKDAKFLADMVAVELPSLPGRGNGLDTLGDELARLRPGPGGLRPGAPDSGPTAGRPSASTRSRAATARSRPAISRTRATAPISSRPWPWPRACTCPGWT